LNDGAAIDLKNRGETVGEGARGWKPGRIGDGRWERKGWEVSGQE